MHLTRMVAKHNFDIVGFVAPYKLRNTRTYCLVFYNYMLLFVDDSVIIKYRFIANSGINEVEADFAHRG